jgi:ribosomal protein S18 acetylase RimI-like enzyme
VTPPTDIDLLGIRAEGSFDRNGRVSGLFGLTIACAGDGQSLWIGAAVPDAQATELTAVFAAATPSRDPAAPPPALEPCRRLLDTGGRSLLCKAGPSFLFPEDVRFLAPGIHIERSDGANKEALRGANPGNWQPVEWDELLDGRLGPWAMAIDGELVVSICHTPGPIRARAAECGVWTRPAYRGRGYGAAVTSAWAAIMRSPGRHLFYDTDADNLSSQRLTRRLHLRPLGWTWRLAPAPDGEDGNLHPLCSLRRRP